jgi:PQQ-like domain
MRRLLSAICPLAIVAALSSPAVAGDWSQVAHDAANTNVADADSTITTTTVHDLDLAWWRPLAGAAVVADGSLFVDPPRHHPLEILDLVTGKTTATIADGWFEGPAAVAGDTVIVQRPTRFATDGSIVAKPAVAAFSIGAGTRRWAVPAGVETYPRRDVVAPTVAHGIVYPGGSGNEPPRPAIDMATGIVRYRTVSGRDWGSKVAVGDGVVVTVKGEDGGTFQVYDASDGTFLWENRRLGAAVAIAGDRLVVSEGGSLAVFDAHTGTRWWRDRRQTIGGTAVTDSAIYGATRTTLDGVPTGTAVRAWSLSDGHVRWMSTVGGPDDRITDPIVVNGVVFVGRWSKGGGASVLALRKTSGALLWAAYAGSGPIGPLAAVDDTLLVPSGDTLRAFRVAS